MFDRRFQHAVVDSTNERALEAVTRGLARHGDLHVAFGQTRGRGRLGRTWSSPEGTGLYLSVVLRPSRPVPPAALTMAAGLAVRDALAMLGLGSRARLKWPNDVLVEGAKLAGILVETRGFDPVLPHYVVGVGVNVAQTRFDEEWSAERPATSLALGGVRAAVQDVERAVCARLEARLAAALGDGHAHRALAADFLTACGLAGERVRARTADAEQRGRLVGLSLDGVVLSLDGGGERRLALELLRELARVDEPHLAPPA